ncbi:MAG TPA: hypothetical protein VF458_17230 [Ktedonobacteraceae bacterium]
MRQVDGSDLLGQGDPRNADIGILYVEAEDSRQEILTAINAQELQGRKQIAIVLPEQGKAFRQPVEFDGLKNMRRGLKAQLIFIAPPGPGPAEFARHRRFVVYSSLETFKSALLDERPLNPRAQAASGEAKKAGILGRGRGNKGRDQGSPAVPPALPTPRLMSGAMPVMPPTPPTPRVSPQSPDPQSPAQGPRFVQPISPTPPSSSSSVEEMETRTLEFENPAVPPRAGMGALTVNALDDNEELAPPVTPRQGPAPDDLSALPTRPEAPTRGPDARRIPTPLLLGQQTNTPRPSGKLPAASAQGSQTRSGSKQPAISTRSSKQLPGTSQNTPDASAETQQPNGKSGNTGKMPAAIPVGVVLPMGASGPAPAGTPASTSSATTVAATGSVSGGSGTGQRQVGLTPLPPPVSRRRRNRTGRRILLISLIVFTLLLIGGLVASGMGGFKGLASFGHLTATVTITPRSQTVQNQYLLTGVQAPAQPDPNQRQIAVRTVKQQSNAQQATGKATGSIPATRAVGQLIFFNNTSADLTIAGNGKTVLTGATTGVQITFNEPVLVPATGSASATINDAYAIQPGANGNIPALDIRGTCCVPGSAISVKNTSPFHGGVDAQPNIIIQQSDIDGAAKPLVTQLTQSTQAALQKEIKSTERIVDNSPASACPAMTTADHKVGDHASSFTVTVSVTCTEQVFDFAGAQQIATNLLSTDPPKNVDLVGYKLVGQVITSLVSATVLGGEGQVRVDMQAAGKWVYQFDAQKQAQIKLALIKRSKADAQTILAQYAGVFKVNIDISSGSTMPDNVNDITLNFVSIAGLTPGPSSTPTLPGSSSPVANTPTACPSAKPNAAMDNSPCP